MGSAQNPKIPAQLVGQEFPRSQGLLSWKHPATAYRGCRSTHFPHQPFHDGTYPSKRDRLASAPIDVSTLLPYFLKVLTKIVGLPYCCHFRSGNNPRPRGLEPRQAIWTCSFIMAVLDMCQDTGPFLQVFTLRAVWIG